MFNKYVLKQFYTIFKTIKRHTLILRSSIYMMRVSLSVILDFRSALNPPIQLKKRLFLLAVAQRSLQQVGNKPVPLRIPVRVSAKNQGIFFCRLKCR